MLQVRCRAALCVRELAQRKVFGVIHVAVRLSTATATGRIEQSNSSHSAAAKAAAAAVAAAAPASGDTSSAKVAVGHVQESAARDERDIAQTRGMEEEPPVEMHPESRTPEEKLVSKLVKIRSTNGADQLTQARNILLNARKEGVCHITAYNVVIKLIGMQECIDNEMVNTLEVLLAKLKEDGLAPNTFTYNGVIFVYAQARSLSDAERTYREMLSRGVEPNLVTLSHMVVAQAWGSSNDMYETLAEMDARGWTPTRLAHISAIALMWRRKDHDGVLKMMKGMRENRLQPTEAAFAVALMSSGCLGRADFAKVIFDWRSSSGLGPKRDVYSSMMLAHSNADLHEESLGYWRQLVCLDGVGQVAIDVKSCRSALKCAVVTNQWDEVETIAGMMKGQAARTAEQTCKLAIAACKARSGAKRPDFAERVERVVDILRRTGVRPSPEVVCRVAMACADGEQWERAAELFKQVLAQGVEMWAGRWEKVIQTYFVLGRFRDVKDTWMRSNTEHTVRGNELAMQAAQRLRDRDWAKKIMALLACNGSKKGLEPATLMIAVEMLAEIGTPGQARELLKEWTPHESTRINFNNFNELLLCCERHGGSDVMLRLYQVLRKHDPLSRLRRRTFALMARALCEHGRAGELAAFFEEQLAAEYQPESECYEILSRGALQAGDREASVRFSEAARNLPALGKEEAAAVPADSGPKRGIGGDGYVGVAGDIGGGAGEGAAAGRDRDRGQGPERE